jgi:hypothetical protein
VIIGEEVKLDRSHPASLFPVARIVGGLAAAGLAGRKDDLQPLPPEQRNTRQACLGIEEIDQAGGIEVDAVGTCCQPPLLSRFEQIVF